MVESSGGDWGEMRAMALAAKVVSISCYAASCSPFLRRFLFFCLFPVLCRAPGDENLPAE